MHNPYFRKRWTRQYEEPVKPIQEVKYRKTEVAECEPVKMACGPKVSSTFGESLPILSDFVKMYGKSFAHARR